MGKILRNLTNYPPILFIRFYRRFISRFLPPSCRFHPSCSAYGLEAFQTYSFPRAVWLTCWRILRCNPFNAGGYDPVPSPDGSAIKPPVTKPEDDES